MKINGVFIQDTFAEAFPMKATRIIITGVDDYFAKQTAIACTGFATSVIACNCEAAIEKKLAKSETPDGRTGYSVLFFAISSKKLKEQIQNRVGQTVMTAAGSACYAGILGNKEIPVGKAIRYFGDGYQISKMIGTRRFWRIPLMHGEFVCEDTTGITPGIGGGNFLIYANNIKAGLAACRKAVDAIAKLDDVITPFPAGIVGSGSKVGSKYKALPASTNQKYCPSLKGGVESALSREVGSVLEIVIDGLSFDAIAKSMQVGINAICRFGKAKGILAVSAGNYGGKLGPNHFHLHKILK